MELIFRPDRKERNGLFTPDHYSHPAKMNLGLQRWIIDRYTKPSNVILDPMAGCGTALVGSRVGRHIILVELEGKFIKMCQDNWAKIQTIGPEMGYEMGIAQIIQADAQNLEGILCDVIVSSPPFSDSFKHSNQDEETRFQRLLETERCSVAKGDKWSVSSEAAICRRLAAQDWGYGSDPDNIGNLPYGNIDCIISSPPYQRDTELHGETHEKARQDGIQPRNYVDSIITSPPYEEGKAFQDLDFMAKQAEDYPDRLKRGLIKGHNRTAEAERRYLEKVSSGRPENSDNIGNLKGATYLEAMLQVYQECHKVLNPQGLMILVTKNFIRKKRIVRLDEDTTRLCQEAGFKFVERHYRKLISQSFWRRTYQRKYPDAPVIDKEDILVFQRA